MIDGVHEKTPPLEDVHLSSGLDLLRALHSTTPILWQAQYVTHIQPTRLRVTRIDFYLIADVDAAAKLRFACRVAYRAAVSGNKVHILTSTEEQSIELDGLMWSYPPEMFLPHTIIDNESDSPVPVLINWKEPIPGRDDVLINLGETVPDFFGRFERVTEIVSANEKEAGRLRYKYYRDRGYPLFHHELDNWEEK